jgi:glyoxylase-like metal-dependent hydrolase (beta-lactamase superfamily II)
MCGEREGRTVSGPQFERLHERVWRLPAPFRDGAIVNLYLVRGEKTALVDSGVLGTPTTCVAPALEMLGLTLGDVDFLLNTHGHIDHLGGNGEMKDAGADIAIHHDDAPRAHSRQILLDRAADEWQTLGLDRVVPQWEAFLLQFLGRDAGVDRVLEDGDVVDLGADVRLQVVHTPGHTGGSVCYWWEETGLLIAGDAVQCRGGGRGALPVIEEAAVYPTSLSRVEELRPAKLLMAHGFRGPIDAIGPIADGTRVAEALRESRATHEALTQAFSQARADEPGADDGHLARAAVEAARASLGLEDQANTGLPFFAVPTLPAYLRATERG